MFSLKVSPIVFRTVDSGSSADFLFLDDLLFFADSPLLKESRRRKLPSTGVGVIGGERAAAGFVRGWDKRLKRGDRRGLSAGCGGGFFSADAAVPVAAAAAAPVAAAAAAPVADAAAAPVAAAAFFFSCCNCCTCSCSFSFSACVSADS